MNELREAMLDAIQVDCNAIYGIDKNSQELYGLPLTSGLKDLAFTCKYIADALWLEDYIAFRGTVMDLEYVVGKKFTPDEDYQHLHEEDVEELSVRLSNIVFHLKQLGLWN